MGGLVTVAGDAGDAIRSLSPGLILVLTPEAESLNLFLPDSGRRRPSLAYRWERDATGPRLKMVNAVKTQRMNRSMTLVSSSGQGHECRCLSHQEASHGVTINCWWFKAGLGLGSLGIKT